MSIIDLHIHSCYSDGAFTPFQIIDTAVQNNVKFISITDHDTLDAYSPSVFQYAKEKHIELITGVEISTQWNNHGFHVLGYQIDLDNKELNELLYSLQNARLDYLSKVSKKLRELGYIIHEDDFQNIDIVTKVHIAQNIVQNQANQKLLFQHFSHIPLFGEFIETMMNENCPAYVQKKTISPIEASDIIKKANGIVILAHPVCYQYEDDMDEDKIIYLAKLMKADGIEAIYIYIDQNQKKINDIEKWKKLAIQNNLFITIGSDFHNDDHIHPYIGLINEDIQAYSQDIKVIINNLKK